MYIVHMHAQSNDITHPLLFYFIMFPFIFFACSKSISNRLNLTLKCHIHWIPLHCTIIYIIYNNIVQVKVFSDTLQHYSAVSFSFILASLVSIGLCIIKRYIFTFCACLHVFTMCVSLKISKVFQPTLAWIRTTAARNEFQMQVSLFPNEELSGCLRVLENRKSTVHPRLLQLGHETND